MLKLPRYAAPLVALAVVVPLAASAVASIRLPESHKGVQRGATILGDKTTPKRSPTHSAGSLSAENANGGRLRGPEIHESGMGHLTGGDKPGDKSTPKRTPTFRATPK